MDPQAVAQIGQQNEEIPAKEEPAYIEIEIPFNLFQYLSSENFNIQTVCRICLSINNKVMYPLDNTKENNVLAAMFTSIVAIRPQQDDGLPSSICELCQSVVVQFYEFKSKCEKSDCMLRSILKGEFETKGSSDHSVPEKQEKLNLDNVIIDEIKEEPCLLDDNEVQYLADLSDDDDDKLLIVQETQKSLKEKANPILDDNILEEIVKLEKKPKIYTCNHCSKAFRTVKAYHLHVKSKHGEKLPHPCPHCKKAFSSKEDLSVHSALHAKGPIWKCNRCAKEFNNRITLRRHVQRHMQFLPHSCATCGKSFAELYALRRHTRVHTGERLEKKHACHVCDKRYASRALLSAHVLRHGGALPCECSVCHKRFPSLRLLTSHSRVHNDTKPYQCDYCDQCFRHESTRNTHHRTHTGEKPYICSVCGKSFIQNSNLTLHMRTHTGERPYSCSVCDRKFASGSSLKTHERIHSGERPYSCDVCGKRFSRMNLSAHMRVHSSERPHACSACPRKFLNASRLREHCRIHTGEKPYQCSYCTCTFATTSHLKKHMKSHDTPKKKSNSRKKESLVIQQVPAKPPEHNEIERQTVIETTPIEQVNSINNNVTLDIIQEVPLEVTREMILQDDGNMKGDLLVVDNSQPNYQISNNLCLNTDGVNIINSEVNYTNDVNLVTVNEGGVSISASTLEGTTVKLYQLDQSLVQIHSTGGQVTISKITSKMTANF